jgi:ubiquinone/menaquinone biosynthesis C-methylase UbiE
VKYLLPHLNSDSEVLSVGCGPGTVLRAISAMHPTIQATGLDVSPVRVRQAKEKNAGNPRVRLVCGDAQDMEFPTSSFDVVYSRMLMEYLTDKEKAVAEMVRVCRPGGVVLLQDLDGQLVWHYPEDAALKKALDVVTASFAETGFDPFVGRKLFWLARNAGLESVDVQVECYHLIAGEVDPEIYQQWELKLEIAKPWMARALGGERDAEERAQQFLQYLRRPDTLTYSNVFTVTGRKPFHFEKRTTGRSHI